MHHSIVVLRHAQAGTRGGWKEGDRSRPLDPAGLAQSLRLVAALDAVRVDRIWTSPFARCQQTVTAIASSRRVPVVDRAWLGEDAAPRELLAGLAAIEPYTLLCTHGDVTRLIGDAWAPEAALGELAKAAAWVFDFGTDALEDVTHLPAPAGAHGRRLVDELAHT